jgi:hypothetical protein
MKSCIFSSDRHSHAVWTAFVASSAVQHKAQWCCYDVKVFWSVCAQSQRLWWWMGRPMDAVQVSICKKNRLCFAPFTATVLLIWLVIFNIQVSWSAHISMLIWSVVATTHCYISIFSCIYSCCPHTLCPSSQHFVSPCQIILSVPSHFYSLSLPCFQFVSVFGSPHFMFKSIVHQTTWNGYFTVWAYTASQSCITVMSLGIAQLVSFCIKVVYGIRFVICIINGWTRFQLKSQL